MELDQVRPLDAEAGERPLKLPAKPTWLQGRAQLRLARASVPVEADGQRDEGPIIGRQCREGTADMTLYLAAFEDGVGIDPVDAEFERTANGFDGPPFVGAKSRRAKPYPR